MFIIKKVNMTPELKAFIKKELMHTSSAKYYRYIDEYIENITPHQLLYWQAWMEGKMSIYS